MQSSTTTTIELPSRSVRDYLAQFGAAPIYVTSSCRIGTGRDLARVGPLACPPVLWARDRATADAVVMAVGDRCPSTPGQAVLEIMAAAARIGAVLSEHTMVMERARAATAKLDARLSAAQSSGVLQFFNSEFRRRRLAARSAGKRFMPYAVAQKRLRRLLAAAAAGAPMPELMRAVFEG